MNSRIRPNLWFDTEAEEAARFYVGIFKDSKLGTVTHYPEAGNDIHGKPAGSVMTAEFELNGLSFIALNGGTAFRFNEAISFEVRCEDQAEVDYYWEKLGEGGDPDAQQCGWLKDKYGVSWQIVPVGWEELINHPEKEKAERAMSAMLQMKKLDIGVLRQAVRGSADQVRCLYGTGTTVPWEVTMAS